MNDEFGGRMGLKLMTWCGDRYSRLGISLRCFYVSPKSVAIESKELCLTANLSLVNRRTRLWRRPPRDFTNKPN